jgi:prevent-host-death family protein
VETTARELNQHTAQVLARVEAGETFTVTRNGRPLAILRPYGAEDPVAYPFRTDPMGRDDSAPTFCGPADFAERVDDLMAGFGVDE